MATRREEILQALQARLIQDPFFPPQTGVDEPEPTNWRTAIPGEKAALADHCTVLDGECEPTRDGGPEYSWELNLAAQVGYSVQGVDQKARRRRRDQAQEHLVAILRQDPQLGLDDPQILAQVGVTERDDMVPVKATAPVAVILMTVNILFVADSAAG